MKVVYVCARRLISWSMAARLGPNARAVHPYVPVKSSDRNFEDKLKQFMQVSDSKMSGNRLFEQQKRSRGRRK